MGTASELAQQRTDMTLKEGDMTLEKAELTLHRNEITVEGGEKVLQVVPLDLTQKRKNHLVHDNGNHSFVRGRLVVRLSRIGERTYRAGTKRRGR